MLWWMLFTKNINSLLIGEVGLKLIRLLLYISSAKFWITCLNNCGRRLSFSWLNMSPECLVQQAKQIAKEMIFIIFSSIKSHKKFLSQIPHSLHYSFTREWEMHHTSEWQGSQVFSIFFPCFFNTFSIPN